MITHCQESAPVRPWSRKSTSASTDMPGLLLNPMKFKLQTYIWLNWSKKYLVHIIVSYLIHAAKTQSKHSMNFQIVFHKKSWSRQRKGNLGSNRYIFQEALMIPCQPAFTCSKVKIEALESVNKSVNNKDTWTTLNFKHILSMS